MIAASPRVLAVTNMYPTTDDPGYGAFVADQMDWVTRCGIDLVVEFVDGRRGRRRYLAAIARVRHLARAGGFDAVHAHYGLTGFVASFQHLPLVVSFCGDDLLGTPDHRGGITASSRLQRMLSRYAARRADGIVCKSEQLRDALPDPADRTRAHVIPNGVDTTRFFPADRATARRRLGLNPAERLVLFPHTPLVLRKRFDLAEAAVQRLTDRGLPARLWVVHGVPHAEMPDYYRAADCLLVTSDQEGSPNVVKEALCCDLPVVSVDVGDVRRWVESAPGSLMVERDAGSIAEGLRQIMVGDGRADGARVRAELSAEKAACAVIAVYREAIKRRG